MYDPQLGFHDEGADLEDPALYAEAAGGARRLHPVAYRSKVFGDLEDDRIWTRGFVTIGLGAQIPETGDLLPFTVGVHGIHVQRGPDGGLEGRFNKAQHGGCRAIPAQCRMGRKTKCSFTSCGYSRDRDAILAAELAGNPNIDQQYLGMRPERLLPVRVAEWGPWIMVDLDPGGAAAPALPAAGDLFAAAGLTGCGAHVELPAWRTVRANWKAAARAHAARPGELCASGSGAGLSLRLAEGACAVHWLFPNLVVYELERALVSLVLQPVAPDETVQRLAVIAPTEAEALDAAWAVAPALDAASAAAEEDQALLARWGTPSAPRTDAAAPPAEDSPAGRLFQAWLVDRLTAAAEPTLPVPLFGRA